LFLLGPVTIPERGKRTLPENQDHIFDHNFSVKADMSEFLLNTYMISDKTWEIYEQTILPGVECAQMAFCLNYQKMQYTLTQTTKIFSASNDVRLTVVVGKHDYVSGYEDVFSCFEKFMNKQIYLLAEAGHNIQIDQPKQMFSYFIDFLADFVQAAL